MKSTPGAEIEPEGNFHDGLGNYYPGKDIEEYSIKELIWDRAEYDIQYFEDTYVVTGHTPT
mgnify:FL=1